MDRRSLLGLLGISIPSVALLNLPANATVSPLPTVESEGSVKLSDLIEVNKLEYVEVRLSDLLNKVPSAEPRSCNRAKWFKSYFDVLRKQNKLVHLLVTDNDFYYPLSNDLKNKVMRGGYVPMYMSSKVSLCCEDYSTVIKVLKDRSGGHE